MLRICRKIDEVEENVSKRNKSRDLIFVSFRDDGVYLNGSRLIDKRAKLQIAIVKLLMRQHLLGMFHSTRTGLNTLQISLYLEKEGFSSHDLEKYVRQSIHRIKKSASEKYNKKIGEDFIQSSKSLGQYKLGENVVLIDSKIAC